MGKKLVRDRIPEKIRRNGEPCSSYRADDDEYWRCLTEKLLEEAREAIEADNPVKLCEEVGDVLEVIDAILRFKRIPLSLVLELKEGKARQFGKFDDRIILQTS